MSAEKKLGALFDFQKFEGNAALQGVIDSVHARYGSAGGRSRELSMGEMERVYAAGQQMTQEQVKAMGLAVPERKNDERT